VSEAHLTFACFGGTASVHVRGEDTESGETAARGARSLLLDGHRRLSRFEPGSELSRLNRDRRSTVPASPLLRELAAAATEAGEASGGLVDATLLGPIERAGYRESLAAPGAIGLRAALESRRERAPAQPAAAANWRSIGVDWATGTISRPPAVGIDSGGIAKGLLADRAAAELGAARAFAVDCCGDIRLGGRAGQERAVLVEDPFGGEPVHELRLREGAVATSGIGRRCWIGPGGALAHHILDPCSGRSAFTGLVQATALGPTALHAETYAKAALLAGPADGGQWLPHGGVLVDDGGEVEVVAALAPAVPGSAA
jgi:thiamine biosynthesis lipoprotein